MDQKDNCGVWEGKDLVISLQHYLFQFCLHHISMEPCSGEAATSWAQESSSTWAGVSTGIAGTSRRCWKRWSKTPVNILTVSSTPWDFCSKQGKATLEMLAKASWEHRMKIHLFPSLPDSHFGTWGSLACECFLCLPKLGHTHKQFYKLKTNTSVTKPA